MPDKLELIQQLLAKAESTTPEEAEALTAAAEKLMIRYGIDQAMLQAKQGHGIGEPIIEDSSITYTGVQAIGYRLMASAIARELPITMLRHGRLRYERVFLVGYESDVKRAVQLLQSLQVQAHTAMLAWLRGFDAKEFMTQQQVNLAKREFLYAFGEGASERLHVETDEVVSEVPGSELVLFDRVQRVEEEVARTYPNTKNSRRVAGSRFGAAEGLAAGRQANTGESQFAGKRALQS